MSTGEDKRHCKKGCIPGIIIGVIATIGGLSIYTFAVSSRGAKISSSAPEMVSFDNYAVKRVPDFIIIGVRKGGTRALISMLDSHPQIVSAKGEVHFFDHQDKYENEGMSWYINRMPLSQNGELIAEKTPSYFVNPYVPKRMAESLPRSLKLILIVREPIIRSISDFTQLDVKRIRHKKTRPSFETVAFKPNGEVKNTTSVIRDSLYDVHYSRWLQYFNPNQILIIDGDQLASNPLKELVKVETYLNIKAYFNLEKLYYNETKGFYCWKTERDLSHCLGSAKGREHPEISEDTREKLKAYFKPHMVKFCELAHINMSFCYM